MTTSCCAKRRLRPEPAAMCSRRICSSCGRCWAGAGDDWCEGFGGAHRRDAENAENTQRKLYPARDVRSDVQIRREIWILFMLRNTDCLHKRLPVRGTPVKASRNRLVAVTDLTVPGPFGRSGCASPRNYWSSH